MPFAFTETLAHLDVAAPFLGRWEIERRRGRPYRANLGANEGLFGASPRALEVLANHSAGVVLYSDPVVHDLRETLAAAWRRPRAHFVVENGIEGLLSLFVRAFIAPGDVAVTSHGGYPSFDYYVRGAGGQLAGPPYLASGGNDLQGLLDVARRRTPKLLYLANPDNPTGAFASARELRDLVRQLPGGCVLLLDEAYVEFAPHDDDVWPLDETVPNVVRLRTFSKAYGLAGARVGYAVADPEIVAALDRIRQHYAVAKLSQEMATAAFGDRAFVADVVERTRRGRDDYHALATRIGARSLPSAANFVAFDFGDAARAGQVARFLDDHDVYVRHPPTPPLDRLIRFTVGPAEARGYLSDVLLQYEVGSFTR
jgi:histidinol-phosphate aminotransferase